MKIQTQVNQKAYKADDGFIAKYQRLITDVVIPYQYSVLEDSAEGNAEKSHVIQNFINAGNVLAGKGAGDGFYGMVFQDSDAAKWLEAAAYSLVLFPDKRLEAAADRLIEIIAAAQDKDGYLDTYFTIKDTDRRWQNLLEGHEMYCSGHMMEAACAYFEATGKRTLLEVMERNMEHIYSVFMDESSVLFNGYPGHPEIELALMKLYSLTKNPHALELAKHFIDKRGVDSRYFENERNSRSWTVWGSDGKDTAYNQSNLPVRKMMDATGHAVRAVYLYTGMADLAGQTDDEELKAACRRLWKSITRKRMYITGGIGSTGQGEAFTVDYDLPSDTAYCETCASIGLIFFASRMLELEVDREYSDVMERAFYNTVLAGMQQDGKRFFYVNPLEVIPGIAGTAVTHRHDLPERPTWYACACCPPNVARLVTSFGKYAYGENEGTVFCHLFAAGTVHCENGAVVECRTDFPYGFRVEYNVGVDSASAGAAGIELAVRIPAWSRSWQLSRNGEVLDSVDVRSGYAYISCKNGDSLVLELDSNPYMVYPSPLVPDLAGQVAVCRGPLVYCAEGVDNGGELRNLSVNARERADLSVCAESDGDTALLKVPGHRQEISGSLYSAEPPVYKPEHIIMRPYYTWANRGLTQMKVWFSIF